LNSIKDLTEKKDGTGANRVSRLKDYFIGSILIGLFVFIIVFVTSWVLLSLGDLVLIPIELQIQGQNAVIMLLGYIIIVTLLAIISIPSIVVIGFINRSVVGNHSKGSIPRNRKWLILQGLILYVVTMLWFIPYLEFLVSLQTSLIPWSETFPGTMGDGFVVIIISVLRYAFIIPTGLFGYLVAFKLPLFRNDSHDEIECSEKITKLLVSKKDFEEVGPEVNHRCI